MPQTRPCTWQNMQNGSWHRKRCCQRSCFYGHRSVVCRTCDANEFARSSPFSNCDASHKLPAVFEATVNCLRSYTREPFVQAGDAAIFIFLTKDPKLSPGDRIL